MSESRNIYTYEWCELVFEDKNKEYGAYNLRLSSSRRHIKALIFAVSFFTLAILSPIIIKNVMPETKEKMTEVTALSDLKVEAQKPKDDIKIPDQAPPPELKNSIKFTPPVIKPDEEVADDEMPDQSKLNEAKEAISTATVTGGSDDGVDIATLNTNQGISNEKEEAAEVFTVVEQQPEFPGGDEERVKFLAKNTHYPTMAKETGVTGTVFVEFVVRSSGDITDITIKRGIGGGCDEEAIRVVKAMPKWLPGKQRGKSVNVKFVLPLKFRLD